MKLFCSNYLITKNYKIIDNLIGSCSGLGFLWLGIASVAAMFFRWDASVLLDLSRTHGVWMDLSGSRAPKALGWGSSGADDHGVLIIIIYCCRFTDIVMKRTV